MVYFILIFLTVETFFVFIECPISLFRKKVHLGQYSPGAYLLLATYYIQHADVVTTEAG